MFKTLTATATLTAAATTADFFQGAQTAIFLRDEEDFADYNCPEPEMDEKVEKYLNMVEPVKMMMGGNQSKKTSRSKGKQPVEEENNGMVDMLDKLVMYGEQVGVIMSVMGPDYEGGDFCQGLTAAFEAKQVAMKVGTNFVKHLFDKKPEDVYADDSDYFLQ